MALLGSCQRISTLSILAILLTLALAAVDSTCYYPNGTAADDYMWPYTPCKPRAPHSMCCRTSSTDTCRSDGLCDSNWDGNTWRVFCTDSTWRAPACVKLCLDSDGTDGDGNTGGSVHVTPCQDGSYCCGAGTEGNSCCAQGNGVFLANNGQTTNVNPSSTSAQSTASTTSTSSSTVPPGAAAATSQTDSAPSAAATKTTEKTTNNTGAIVGGVVGGLVLAALVVVAGLWLLRKRKIKETAEKRPWIPYATGSQPGYFAEVEGANTRMELPAPLGTEMPTEDSRMKKYQVHELQ